MPSSVENFRHFSSFIRTALNYINEPCPCADCEDVRDGRREIILQLSVILPQGQGCPFIRGCRAMHGMLLQREQSLDHRLVPKSLTKMVDILRLCVDPVTTRAVWSMCQHFKVDGSPISGVHELGIDYHYNEDNKIVWAIGPMNNELSQARKEDVRALRRMGVLGFIEATGDIPTTRLDMNSWDWESQP